MKDGGDDTTTTTSIHNGSSCLDSPPMPTHHTAVVLFYKYFLTKDFPLLHQHAAYYEPRIVEFLKSLCQRLRLKGRVLLSVEGVNGTLSAANTEVLEQYIQEMEQFELLRDCGVPNDGGRHASSTVEPTPLTDNHHHQQQQQQEQQQQQQQHYEHLFQDIDWKKSSISSNTNTNHNHTLPEPFPDLKISIVKEIISSGGGVQVDELLQHGGEHLEPKEFHRVLQENPNVVLIDVRNAFECDIGHFVNPHTNQAAINPEMVKFSEFDDIFCAPQADALKDKKVLMYCTGGIRCEKASCMLKRRGVPDVSQLKGGIHRYLEEFGNEGFFRGKNFVFDQRVAMTPHDCQQGASNNGGDAMAHNTICTTNRVGGTVVVGRCVACQTTPYDELSGSRICTVCRDPLLVCPSCQETLREYHCRRHQAWKHCYFTFLEVFTSQQLEQQRSALKTLIHATEKKNLRRTLNRQIEKINDRIQEISTGTATVVPDAPRRCRACMDPRTLCDGLCWGLWKTMSRRVANEWTPQILPIQVGDTVKPGPHWNALRLGTPQKDNGGDALRRGNVV